MAQPKHCRATGFPSLAIIAKRASTLGMGGVPQSTQLRCEFAVRVYPVYFN